MAAYSIDLRKKILSAWSNKEGTQRELAKRFKVSLSFIRDFLRGAGDAPPRRRYRETGEIAARPQGGDRRSKLKGEKEELLKIMVTEQDDIYLREIQEKIKENEGIEVSISSLSRTLKRLNFKRKKNVSSD
jgi:transposase